MFTVYIVDGKTRIHLPSTAWGVDVQRKLVELGHTVQATGENWALNRRDCAEMLRVARLLDSTGL